MYKILFSAICVLLFFYSSAQDFQGQWKGEFIDKSTASGMLGSDKCDYVLELDVHGNSVSGSSYTYFTDGGKKYYTICKVEGTIDQKKKYIEVRETARTKTNIPNNINNCLQVHKLTYFKQGNNETIEGKWIPAPNQSGDCGFGTTVLTRRTLINTFPTLAKNNTKIINNKNKELKKIENNIAKVNTPAKTVVPEKSLVINQPDKTDKTNDIKDQVQTAPKTNKPDIKTDAASKLESRKTNVIKTIEVENKTVKVDLYDNGEIDGDSISVFYNKRLLLSNKKLSDKSISLVLNIDDEDSVNELVMYAENLGSIPPNTALMVVTDGPNRYEVRITSDLQKSGVINFVHKK